jgi:transcriptional regulator with XRE-family HTH domain
MQDNGQCEWYGDETATFGDRLAAAREALGLTQSGLARKLGVATRSIKSWEGDLSEPRANKLQMLAGLLNVSLMWLLTGEGEGVAAPQDATLGAQDAKEILLEMRKLQVEYDILTDRLGLLEKRLRKILEG